MTYRLSLGEVFQRGFERGGKEVLALGKTGGGKTTLLHGLLNVMADRDICIFRGMKTGQEFRSPRPLNIIGYQTRPQFYDSFGNPFDMAVSVQNDFDGVLKACKLGMLNSLYMPWEMEQQYWADFMRFIVARFSSRYASNFISVFMDEAEDIIPAPEKGKEKITREFLKEYKEARKCLVSSYLATQQESDIHWKARGKLQYRIYLQGAFIPKHEKRVKQKAVDNLPLGVGIISGSFFGHFSFPNYPPKKAVIVR